MTSTEPEFSDQFYIEFQNIVYPIVKPKLGKINGPIFESMRSSRQGQIYMGRQFEKALREGDDPNYEMYKFNAEQIAKMKAEKKG